VCFDCARKSATSPHTPRPAPVASEVAAPRAAAEQQFRMQLEDQSSRHWGGR
jgi:hypothetical protein